MNEIDQALTSFYLTLGWEPYTWFALFVLVYIGVCAWNLYQIRKGF